MARKLALKVVAFGVAGPANGGAPPAVLDYGATMTSMLRVGGGQGMSFEEVLRACEAIGPIEKAISEGKKEVTLSDAQWQYLREKLEKFPFAFADPAIVGFGLMIRNAPEIT